MNDQPAATAEAVLAHIGRKRRAAGRTMKQLAWRWRANYYRRAATPGGDGFWTLPDHAGRSYQDALRMLHAQLQPQRYLEIGTANGGSLTLAKCPSIAIDVAFQLDHFTAQTLNKPVSLLFQMPSDTFFERYSPATLLKGPVDLAFLDGMHHYEFLLRDFINTERHCLPNSVILMHDCVPTDAFVARRNPDDRTLRAFSAHPNWWAGDVWKAALIIRRLRPDLRILAFDAPPTGLVAITNLDPGSNVLAQAYPEAVAAHRDLTLGAFGPEAYLRLMGARHLANPSEDLAGLLRA